MYEIISFTTRYSETASSLNSRYERRLIRKVKKQVQTPSFGNKSRVGLEGFEDVHHVGMLFLSLRLQNTTLRPR